MKRLLLFLVLIAGFASSCKKKATVVNYKYTGYIEGPDMTTTSCSGGYLMFILTEPAAKRFDALPEGSGIDLATATFPVKVKFNWHYKYNNYYCHHIVIDAIEKVN